MCREPPPKHWGCWQRVTDALVEGRELIGTVAGEPRIDFYDRAPFLSESEILILKTMERDCEES